MVTVLSILPRLMDYDYPFGIFKLFLRCAVRLYLQLFVGVLMSYLRYLFLFVYSGVHHISCCVFVLLFFVLSTLRLLVSLDCPFLSPVGIL
jgi:hypothetical protein